MKTDAFFPRGLRVAVLGTLLLLTHTGCDKRDLKLLSSPSPCPSPVPAPNNPGPHSTILVDTTVVGQGDYQDPGGGKWTLDVTLPALDSAYQDPDHADQYLPIEKNLGGDGTPAAGVHNVVVVRMDPSIKTTPLAERVKIPPFVIVRTGKGPANGTPAPPETLTGRPIVILNLGAVLPTPSPKGTPCPYPVTR